METVTSAPRRARLAVAVAIIILTVAMIGSAVSFFLLKGGGKSNPQLWSVSGARYESVAALPGGEGMIVGGSDNTLTRLDASGKTVWTMPTTGTVKDLDLSPDGTQVAAITESRQVLLVGIDSGKADSSWDIPYPGIALSWGEAGIAVSQGTGTNHRIGMYDLKGAKLWESRLFIITRTLAFGEDGKTLFAGNDSSQVSAYDASGKRLWLHEGSYPVNGLAESGGLVVYADKGGNAGAIDSKGKRVWNVKLSASLSSVAVIGDKRFAALDKSNLLLVDGTGHLTGQTRLEADAAKLAYDKEGDRLAAAGARAVYLDAAGLSAFGSSERLRGVSLTILAISAPLLAIAIAAAVAMRSERTRLRTVRLGKRVWRGKTAYMLLLPTIGSLALFNYYPALSAFYHSFTNWKPGLPLHYTGWSNYNQVFHSHFFWTGIENLLALLVSGFLKLAVPLLVAVIIYHLRSERLRYWLRTLFVAPIVVPGIVIVLVWGFFYDPNYGLLNSTLRDLGLDSWTHTWLGEPGIAMKSIIFIGFPWVAPFAFLVFYGGLIGIPGDIYEAAKIEGIGRIDRFLRIELPLLVGQIRLLLILTFIGTMQDFTSVYLTTQGGPLDSTYVPALELYYSASKFSDYGYASAIGVVLFGFIMLGTIFQMRLRSSVEYGS